MALATVIEDTSTWYVCMDMKMKMSRPPSLVSAQIHPKTFRDEGDCFVVVAKLAVWRTNEVRMSK